MKCFLQLLLMLNLVFFVSCSNSSSTDDIDIDSDVVSDVLEDEEMSDSGKMTGPQDEFGSSEEPGTKSAVASNENSEVVTTGEISEKTYQVQENETLMMVSFKLYGNYARWREIAEINQDKLDGNTQLTVGMQLKYLSNGEDFKWDPNGDAYLVKRGDTLGTISNEVYTTPRRWKDIWNNNKPLIKDPDKIFAGFTIYYIPDENKEDEKKPEELAFNEQ
jgi:nucleoid-associated protein YgaU